MTIPLTLEGKGSQKIYVPYFSQKALMLPSYKKGEQLSIPGFTKSHSDNTDLVKSEGFPGGH